MKCLFHYSFLTLSTLFQIILVQGEGFEPPNPKGADLQSAVFNRFTNPARRISVS